ncbi:MAG: alpha-N-arabinofuranosidase [Chitinophagaceae bacterium]|nr:alpha-N-arabinofuranosidase [Chitinophagaceae bacterium]
MLRILFAFFLLGNLALTAQNRIVLFPEKAKDTISKNIYGHFAEHLGRCIYDGIYVGDDQIKIPHINGIRRDIIEALKKLQVPVLRWPGGCFADIYHWKDGIGPKNQRKHINNTAWGNVREDNSFGTHEFLNFCELIGAEPYLAVNMGSGTVQEAVEWVHYVNHPDGASSLTDLRKQNGRDKPWNVKYWGIGNESWDCGGHMSAEYYVNEYKKYATLMTTYGNSEKLFRIAVGPGTEDYDWTETVMKQVPLRRMEGLSIHHYSVIDWNKKGSATQFSEAEYFKTMEQTWRMERIVRKNKEIMDKYDPQKKVALVVDEWGGWYDAEPGTNKAFLFQQNTMRDAMIAGVTLNIFNNHCDRVRMANLAQMVNVLQAVILTQGEKLILTPTYHVMEMYKVHQQAVMIPLTVSCADYVWENKSVPSLSASASKDAAGNVHLSITNIHATKAQEVIIDLGFIQPRQAKARILRSSRLQDFNSFSEPEKIKPQEFTAFQISNNQLKLTLPPASVIVVAVK